MQTDYIPRRDAEFDLFFRNIVEYTTDKCTLPQPEWTHIPAADLAAINAEYTAWNEAYAATLVPHIPQANSEKKRARAASERALRQFVNRFLRYEPVTDIDRDKIGVPNRRANRTPHTSVHENVEFELRLRNIREVAVDFWVKDASGKGKPLGYNGAVIVWAILDEPPADILNLTRHTTATKTPHIFTFDEDQRGKRVYFAACWQNERGLTGAWSEIQSAIIP
jgi:hypothetical protein